MSFREWSINNASWQANIAYVKNKIDSAVTIFVIVAAESIYLNSFI